MIVDVKPGSWVLLALGQIDEREGGNQVQRLAASLAEAADRGQHAQQSLGAGWRRANTLDTLLSDDQRNELALCILGVVQRGAADEPGLAHRGRRRLANGSCDIDLVVPGGRSSLLSQD